MNCNRYEECRAVISDSVRQRIDLSREVSDDEIREMIDGMVVQMGRKYALSLTQRQELGKSVFNAIRKLDVLQELVDCDEVTEIMVNGTESIFVERAGQLCQWEKHFESIEKLENVIQQIVAKCNRAVNEASPIADARLDNGSRVNIVLAPVALNGPVLTIRRFPDHPISMEDLIGFGSVTKEAAAFLEKLVAAGYNIFISGGVQSLLLSWEGTSCSVLLDMPEGRVHDPKPEAPVSGSTRRGLSDLEAIHPSKLGLPGESMEAYEMIPQEGSVRIAGSICVRVNIYGEGNQFAGSYFLSTDGKLYKLDESVNKVVELEWE